MAQVTTATKVSQRIGVVISVVSVLTAVIGISFVAVGKPPTNSSPPPTSSFPDRSLRGVTLDEDGVDLATLSPAGKSLRLGPAWSVQFADPNAGTELRDVFGVDRNDVWAVGDDGTGSSADVVRHFDGSTWSAQTLPTTDKRFTGVWATAAGGQPAAWIVGGNAIDDLGGTILSSTDRGLTWSAADLPAGATARLRDIFGLSSTSMWAVGHESTVLYFDGTTWTRLGGLPSGLTLVDVWAADPSNVWVIGSATSSPFGRIYRCTANCTTSTPTWSANLNVDPCCANHTLTGITGTDAAHLWVSGYNLTQTPGGGRILFSADGNTWTQSESGGGFVTNVTPQIHSIYAVDASHVWAVGYDDKAFFSRGALANSWRTVLGGSNESLDFFQATDNSLNLNLYGVWGDSRGNVWAVGQTTDALTLGRVLFGDGPEGDIQTVGAGFDQTWYSRVLPGTTGQTFTLPTSAVSGVMNVTKLVNLAGNRRVNYQLSLGLCRASGSGDATLCDDADDFSTVGTSSTVSFGGGKASIGPKRSSICTNCPTAPQTCDATSPCRLWFRMKVLDATAGSSLDLNVSGFDSTTSGNAIDQSFLDWK